MPNCIRIFFISSSVRIAQCQFKNQGMYSDPVKHLIQSFCKNSLRKKVDEIDGRSTRGRQLWIYVFWHLFNPNRSCLWSSRHVLFWFIYIHTIHFVLTFYLTVAQANTHTLNFLHKLMLNRILKLICLYIFLYIYL